MMNVQWLLIAIVILAFLAWSLWKRSSADRIQHLNDARRSGSRLVGRGELIDGNRHLQVALALSDSTFYYENADMQGSLDLQWIQEVEYDDELSTGRAIEHGKALRLRCSSGTFEFVLANDVVQQWQALLPPHRMTSSDEGTTLSTFSHEVA